jgi:ankyrin repeat protein
LTLAARNGHAAMVDMLLQFDEFKDALEPNTIFDVSVSPLAVAVVNNHIDVVKVCL